MLVFQRWYSDETPGHRHLVVEGVIVALLGATFAAWLFPDDASLIAVFLAAVSNTDSIERLLDWNRREIQERNRPPNTANLKLASLLLALFAGTTVGFSILAMTLPIETVEILFQNQVAEFGGQSFSTLEFGSAGGLLVHNLYVLLFFFAVAIPFRQGGIMLAVAWNASVWGSSFAILARVWSQAGGPGLVEAYLRVIGACLPHMALEAASYVLAGLAGVFLSKALLKYALESKRLESVIRSVALMLLFAAVLVVLGALWEGFIAPEVVRLLVR